MRHPQPLPVALWLQTASGLAFDLEAPEAEDVDPYDIAHALAYLCRFGGRAQHFYSVAQHSVLVSYLVPEEFALAGLLHDGAEAYVGDLARPVRRMIHGFDTLERRVLGAIADRFGIPLLVFDAPEVIEADRIALLTERDQLCLPPPRPWPEDEPTPFVPSVEILPEVPEEARAAFCRRLLELAPGCFS